MQVQDCPRKVKMNDCSELSQSIDCPQDGMHEYITWYQSVTTIGVKTRAHSFIEAEVQANKTINQSETAIPKDGFFVGGSGIFARTPLEITQTEEI